MSAHSQAPRLLVLLLVLVHASAALAQERAPVRDARTLMLAALESPVGQAQGVLVGEMADAISHRFKSASPIFIDVSTEKRYAQPGCARLNVRFWQDGVLLAGAPGPKRQTVDFGINYCRDGQAPKSLS